MTRDVCDSGDRRASRAHPSPPFQLGFPKGLHNSTPGRAHVAPPPSAVKLLPITVIEGFSIGPLYSPLLVSWMPRPFCFQNVGLFAVVSDVRLCSSSCFSMIHSPNCSFSNHPYPCPPMLTQFHPIRPKVTQESAEGCNGQLLIASCQLLFFQRPRFNRLGGRRTGKACLERSYFIVFYSLFVKRKTATDDF